MVPMQSPQVRLVIEAFRYGYPVLSVLYFISASLFSICIRQAVAQKKKTQYVRRDVLLALMILVVGTYAASAINILVRTLLVESWAAEQHETVYVIASMLVWSIQCFALLETKSPVWYPYYGAWLIAAVSELTLFILPNIFLGIYGLFDLCSLSIQGLRICAIFVLLCIYVASRNRKNSEYSDAECQSLLHETLAPKNSVTNGSNENGNGYGGVSNTAATTEDDTSKNSTDSTESDDEDIFSERLTKAKERVQKRLDNDGNWWTYAKGFSIFIPYVWPVHNKRMQLRAVAVAGCLLMGNLLNIMIPRQLGIVTDALVVGHSPWVAASIYATLTFLNSGSCIGWVQFWLWRPLEQYAYQELSTAAHQHVMSLSSDFHEKKDASDIHRAVNQGQSVTRLVEMVCFEILPMLVDLVAVCIYLNFLFGPYMGLILAVTSLTFLYTTTKLVSLATTKRRLYLKSFRKEWMSIYMSIDNWRTASYFNNIKYEEDRYSTNVKNRLKREKDYRFTIFFVGAVQIFALTVGLMAACFLAIYQVTHGLKTAGEFVILLSYWAQLRGPLTFFSNAYKKVSESMMDAEHLLELFQIRPTIVDSKNAQPLDFKKGEVVFDHVEFGYEARKTTLKDVNFTVRGGSTIAIVGETGGGKSTILKLLDRFYDVTQGSIKIDGQDIRDVTVTSLRDKIGVVPQDPALFNDSIMNNIRYARLGASNNEVYEACKAAAIHEKILTFPDGYQSKVGSHGVKLSGGEKQRIAIARAILKDPEIIVLDEATSSVDSDTEQLIQDAFNELCKGRTTFIVAHRLSTIMRADQILVIKDGEIIENGTHDELIRSKGKYSDLWSKQIIVKPEMDVSPPGSPRERAANIVNDVKLQAGTTTLATALRRTDHTEQNCPSSPTKPAKGGEARLKADAPEFVPSRLRGSTESSSHSKHELHQSSESNGSAMSGSSQKAQDEDGFFSPNESKATSTASKRFDCSGNSNDSGEDSARMRVQGESAVSSVDANEGRPPIKHLFSRYGRRNLTKSEPASQIHDSMDGTQESDAIVGSGEIQPLHDPPVHMNHRRVTAPGDPPSGRSIVRSSSRGRPVRRSRHWRLKSNPGRSSATSGGSSSRGVSTDDSAAPTVPFNTPNEELTGSSIQSTAGS